MDILENELDFMEHCVENPFGKYFSLFLNEKAKQFKF
jgi:hypothetical protein